jgi:hypothetical protein
MELVLAKKLVRFQQLLAKSNMCMAPILGVWQHTLVNLGYSVSLKNPTWV